MPTIYDNFHGSKLVFKIRLINSLWHTLKRLYKPVRYSVYKISPWITIIRNVRCEKCNVNPLYVTRCVFHMHDCISCVSFITKSHLKESWLVNDYILSLMALSFGNFNHH